MNVPEEKLAEARKLHATAHINWEYWTAVNGAWFHNPDMAVRSLSKCAAAAQKATNLPARRHEGSEREEVMLL